mmetsp:Transcript_34933/g.79646  ORF Transcript_34933/g.79646 Transcript_34933/m.79646 type:complete len:130 (-) Transcript_34933:13-402(-)|eukprot:CAMPEP_0114540654 /NCGR_PEP_ID=MMETSP0114-20121206/890_1 /TAXON_ID=31324 /ORGANISM="Goniomonas sp, Strain m" /LENGTH=129 /DNA_ID=CAMNT_0001724845 /DNA_START=102 /DNA_END=491 /DNA_ORIENTATION=+
MPIICRDIKTPKKNTKKKRFEGKKNLKTKAPEVGLPKYWCPTLNREYAAPSVAVAALRAARDYRERRPEEDGTEDEVPMLILESEDGEEFHFDIATLRSTGTQREKQRTDKRAARRRIREAVCAGESDE